MDDSGGYIDYPLDDGESQFSRSWVVPNFYGSLGRQGGMSPKQVVHNAIFMGIMDDTKDGGFQSPTATDHSGQFTVAEFCFRDSGLKTSVHRDVVIKLKAQDFDGVG